MHSALKIAAILLNMAQTEGKSLTPMQLLKLVYICHGWMLGLYRKPLIKDEVQAWKYGPVIPSLYHAIKHFKSNPVTEIPRSYDESELDYYENNLICQVYNIYGGLNGIALSNMTHKAGTPWERTYNAFAWARTISNDLIQSYYDGLSKTTSAERNSA